MTKQLSSAPAPPPDVIAPEMVGVVMPAFNAERTIEAAVRSVLAQTWRNLELVVYDDNSSDNTLAVLATIVDPRLKILYGKVNRGPGPARDLAIRATAAPWIAVIDADDEWVPERIAALMASRGDASEVMIFDDLMQCHDTASGLVPWRHLRGRSAFGKRSSGPRDVPLVSFLVAPRLLIKPLFPAAIMHKYAITHTSRSFGEDTEFFLRLAATGLRLRYVPKPMYRYRITPGSATAVAFDRTTMRQCMEGCADLPGFGPEVRGALKSKIQSLARDESLYAFRDLLRQGRFIALVRAILANPHLLPAGAKRGMTILQYELHRRFHGGRKR